MLMDLGTLPCTNVEKEVRKQSVNLLHEAYVEFGLNCVSYDRKQAASVAAIVAAKAAVVVVEKKSLIGKGAVGTTSQVKSSQAKLQAAQESITEVAKKYFDPIGAWSEDDDIDEGEI